MITEQLTDERIKRLPRNCGEPVVTMWKDGGWKLWGSMDAFYAQADDDFLVNLSVKEVLGAMDFAAANDGCYPATNEGAPA